MSNLVNEMCDATDRYLHSLVKTVASEVKMTQLAAWKSTSERLIVDLKFLEI